ncbi:hypothetical protein DIS24_g2275 [Lasiodiplodia hormozganensis]|uniref:Extracellular membrane protein CFEM domain-containing protein n=1 Tax=Lasiodiplodia hormozganensis TaxID=869390 RepID=A0AA40D439_9PEZI|nr:hypothetical protein DIS24_g2275 [Lasiodiplodia hormozganensis]
MVWALPIAIAVLSPHAYATQSLTDLELPTCASRCLDDALNLSSCADEDDSCLCNNKAFDRQFDACLDANCLARDYFGAINGDLESKDRADSLIAAKNLTDTACGFEVRDKRSVVIWVAGVGATLAYLAIAIRLYTRYFINLGGLNWDDWSTVVTAAFLAPLTAGAILLAKNGLGKDTWTLPLKSITETLWIFYVQEHLYIICTVLVKLSLLLFYLRIFPDATFRKIVWATLVFALCFGFSALFAFAFQCSPVKHAWHVWDEEHPGTCVNINALVLTAAALNTCADFWIIVLPIPGVVKLQSSLRMKLQVIPMFCTGFFITGVSIYRAVMLTEFAKTRNPTWDYCDGGYWSIIEVDVGIICTCMPAIRKLLGQVIPKVFGSTHKATADDPSKTAGHSSRTPRDLRSFKGPGASEGESFVQLIDIESRSAVSHHEPDGDVGHS